MIPEGDGVKAAKEFLEHHGYITLKKKSHEHTLRQLQGEKCMRQSAEEARDRNLAWVSSDLTPWIRHLEDRCTFLYGAARAHGATDEELRQPELDQDVRNK